MIKFLNRDILVKVWMLIIVSILFVSGFFFGLSDIRLIRKQKEQTKAMYERREADLKEDIDSLTVIFAYKEKEISNLRGRIRELDSLSRFDYTDSQQKNKTKHDQIIADINNASLDSSIAIFKRYISK